MTAVDWSICGGYLVLVLAMGWWFSRSQHTNADYFVGSRQMNWVAIGVSLFATTFSALSFVGLPREAAYADYHLYLAILFIPLVVAPIVGWLFIPLYHRLQLTSAYEYLERRFDRRLRLIASLLFCLYTLGWMGNMLYATGLILQAVLGLTDAELTWALIGIGMFTTFYTTIGGMRAVVWTDMSQAFILFVGMLVVLVLAVGRIEGGWETVWRLGSEHRKFAMFAMRFDLTDRGNFFSASAYGLFVYMSAQATGQSAVQRYVSMPTVWAARRSLVVNGVMTAGVCLLFFLVGSALFAFYHQGMPPGGEPGSGFPPLAKGDQLAPHFIQTELALPGLLGMLLAGLFAAVMSSIDSSANSMTTVVVCDWFEGRQLPLRVSRLFAGLFGVGAIIMSLLVPYLGTNVFDILITIAGAFFGPLLGLFTLGIFFRRANAPGAALGMTAGIAALLLIYPTAISPWWYGAFTCIPTLTVGLLASFLFPAPDIRRIQGLMAFGNREAETHST